MDGTENPLRDELTLPRFMPTPQGRLAVPSQPGLGIDVDANKLAAFASGPAKISRHES
jgi:L-alanine-DL-glutamate epimerase-like enolase superfamily enzyme